MARGIERQSFLERLGRLCSIAKTCFGLWRQLFMLNHPSSHRSMDWGKFHGLESVERSDFCVGDRKVIVGLKRDFEEYSRRA